MGIIFYEFIFRIVGNFFPCQYKLGAAVPNNKGMTPIHMAARNGHTDFVQILAPLTENPNAANVFGITPIYQAVPKGHIEIVKILAPLTKNPNAPDDVGEAPSSVMKNAEIRRILKSMNHH